MTNFGILLLISILPWAAFAGSQAAVLTTACDSNFSSALTPDQELEMLAEEESLNLAALERMSQRLVDSSLPSKEAAEILRVFRDGVTRYNEDIFALMNQTKPGVSISAELVRLRAQFEVFAATVSSQIASREASYNRTKAKNQIVILSDMNGDATMVLADRDYVVSKEPSAMIKFVRFSKDIVRYFEDERESTTSRFLHAVQKGFVAARGMSGVKWLTGTKLVEVKVLGVGQHDRLVGCYKSGTLFVMRVLTKHNEGIAKGRYLGLCD